MRASLLYFTAVYGGAVSLHLEGHDAHGREGHLEAVAGDLGALELGGLDHVGAVEGVVVGDAL